MAEVHEDAIALVSATLFDNQQAGQKVLDAMQGAGAEHATNVAALLAGFMAGTMLTVEQAGERSAEDLMADLARRANEVMG